MLLNVGFMFSNILQLFFSKALTMPVKNTEKSQNIPEVEVPQQPEVVPEITLTDKLNKRLLQSFLNRINNTEHNFNRISNTSPPGQNEINEFN
ncbi:hypothetical protein NQ314_009282 [Rhamnusium bicolor]|uniref:Uncharacterized protein n=1 Tax=Rhamnusium bicolor TaxID=1586634 RepID=A0AAV8Y4R3_9CUCU|nr:hypothetical protein NQ314_009282 [Rhamnusium bicolor]